MQVPIQARLDLRDEIARLLPHARSERFFPGDGAGIDANTLLDFCVHHRVSYVGADPKLALKWDRAAKRGRYPKFADLQAGGWVLFDGIRWVHPRVPVGMMNDVVYPDNTTRAFLHSLSDTTLSAAGRPATKEARAMAAEAKAGRLGLDKLGGQRDGHWVASRLWERFCPMVDEPPDAEVDDAFRDWAAWCVVLGGFAAWHVEWSDVAKRRCREAAQRVLGRQRVWGIWGNDVEAYVAIMTRTYGLPSDRLHPQSSKFGDTLIARIDWVDSPAISHLNAERFRGGSAGFALGLLVSELTRSEVIGIQAEPAAFVSRFVAQHPVALFNVSIAIKGAPVLLVDLLLQPSTACLAVRWIAEWVPNGQAWNRVVSDQRSEQTKAFAIQDALSVLAYQIRWSGLDLKEFAALTTWCFSAGLNSSAVKIAQQRLSIGKLLLSIAADQLEDVQQTLFRHLVQKASMDLHVPFGVFGGVVEAVSVMPGLNLADAGDAIKLYIVMARDFQLDRTDVAALSAPLAATLVVMAASQPTDLRDDFLLPVDVATVIAAADPERKVSVRSGLAATLRSHIRLLARAVAGWPQATVPEFLANALMKLTLQAVVDHADHGSVAALGDGFAAFRFFWSERGSPADDLAAAWPRLDEFTREALLTAWEAADDPVLLANLTRLLPDTGSERIRARLLRLVPNEASTAWTWTELSNRVEALIHAKEYDLAVAYLAQAEVAVDRAPVAEQQRLFALKLQLLIERQNWPELDAVNVPATLMGPDELRARQHLDFSWATAQLMRPGGNVEQAFATLTRLSASSSVPAYKENAIAAAIRLLDATEVKLSVQEFQAHVSRLLAEIDLELAARRELGAPSDRMVENRASLLLTLRRPREALDGLAPVRHKGSSPNAELLAAVATDMLGHRSEAKKILDEALRKFNQVERLLEARKELEEQEAGKQESSRSEDAPSPANAEHEPTLSTPAPVVSAVVAPMNMAAMLLRFRSMSAAEVGQVLNDKGLNGYLLNEVCGALSALQQLAPILRHTPSSSRSLEDDLTAFVGKVLNAAFSFVGWQAAEQSPGGAIRKRNQGQRDLVIKASSNTEVSIYEALVCTDSPDLADMLDHLTRLVAYGQVQVSFHVTYAYVKDVANVIQAMDRLIELKPPDGMTLVRSERVHHYATPGIIATYTLGHRTLWVVYLVVDLGLYSEQLVLSTDMPSFRKAKR
ncbi:hypothetical protein DBR42_04645 [Pelomonas sp. HMWF004]|nr:hypothetical protein DBR42_04645 [Pelomonas sp. HMWF004]